jgi:hypothetical protein
MTNRRQFLGALGALPLVSSVARAEPIVATPSPDFPWDLTWVDRVKGAHRAVFDGPSLSDGAALWRAAMWRDQVQQAYGVAADEVTSVLVVRHAAMAMVMNDAYWARFGTGKEDKVRDPQGKKWARANPWRVAGTGVPPEYAGLFLEPFLASGGIVLGCGLAFQGAVERFREADKLSPTDADRVAREHLIPGVILQPSGFFAVLRAQQAGCHFFQGS